MRLVTTADPSRASHPATHGGLLLSPGLLDEVDRSGLLGRVAPASR
jgi:hypothetical protein